MLRKIRMAAAALSLPGCDRGDKKRGDGNEAVLPAPGDMTYRTSRRGDRVSLLGYGMMRLPTVERRGLQRGSTALWMR